jgi:hypothetical protein
MKLNTLQGSVQMIAAYRAKLQAEPDYKPGERDETVDVLVAFVAKQFDKKLVEINNLVERQLTAQAFGF